MSRYSVADFVSSTAQKDRHEGLFELESPRMMEVNLDGSLVWIKQGSMIAYNGDVKFTREGMMEQGLGKMLKKAVTGEGTKLTKAEGNGNMYIADMGKKISILSLSDESLVVNGNDILAFESAIEWDIKLLKMSSMMAGGLTNVKLSGTGMVAITTHYDPLTLRVAPGSPVMTDPNATVAWSGNLNPEVKLDVSIKTFLGRGSGDSVQLKFEGDGFVVVQPYEEVYYQYEGG